MRRLVWDFADRTYHIVGNLISRLILLPLGVAAQVVNTTNTISRVVIFDNSMSTEPVPTAQSMI